MEMPEALNAGTIILTGFDKNIVLSSIYLVIEEFRNENYDTIPEGYEIINTSLRVVKLIQGTTKLNNKWQSLTNQK